MDQEGTFSELKSESESNLKKCIKGKIPKYVDPFTTANNQSSPIFKKIIPQMYRFSWSSNLLEFFSISCFVSKLEGKHWFPNYFNSAHFIFFIFYFEKLESWNFVDTRTFNHSKTYF